MPTIAHTAADGGERLPRTPQVQAGSCWVIRWVILCHTILRHTKYKSSYRWLSVGIGRVNFRSYTNLVRQAMTSYLKYLPGPHFLPWDFSNQESSPSPVSEASPRETCVMSLKRSGFNGSKWHEMTTGFTRLHEASWDRKITFRARGSPTILTGQAECISFANELASAREFASQGSMPSRQHRQKQNHGFP